MRQRIEFDEFEFDPEELTLWKRGEPVKLNPQPAKMLLLLLSHPGTLVERRRIQEALWDDETFVDFDLGINSVVRQMRIALADNAESPRFVETVPKKGYRFIGTLSAHGPQADNAETPPPRWSALSRSRSWLVAGFALATAALLVWLAGSNDGGRRPRPIDGKRIVAVLPFDNVNNDPELDWLRLGLAELLSTNLSQRSRLDVVPTGDVYDVLEERGEISYRATTSDHVDRVASRVHAHTVIYGSFLRGAESIRIQLRVEDVASGELSSATHIDVDDESKIFATVDSFAFELSDRLDASDGATVRAIEELTTSSVEAYRLYAEGIAKARSPTGQAEDSMLRALDEDPEFVEVLDWLATHYFEDGHDFNRARSYAERAMRLAHRLPPRARYEIEGRYYSMRQETWGQAIDAYRSLMTHNPFSHLLGNRHRWLEDYDRCIEILESVRKRGDAQPDQPSYRPNPTYNVLASCYWANGELERAESLYDARFRVQGHRHHWDVFLNMAWNRLDEAETMLADAVRFHEGSADLLSATWELRFLQGRIDDANRALDAAVDSERPQRRWYALHAKAILAMHRGRARESLALLEQAVSAFGEPHRNAGHSENLASRVLLELGRPTEALERAERAQDVAPGDEPEWEGLFWASVATAQSGDLDQARAIAERLAKRTKSIPFSKEKRRYHFLVGYLSLSEGAMRDARSELQTAEALLAPHAIPSALVEGHVGPSSHVAIWYELARATSSLGDDQAHGWLEKIVSSTSERVGWPVRATRALYFLAESYEGRGDTERALELYRRFYERWKDGELDRDRVEKAASKLRELSTTP